ncbi:alginate lyase family protein [Burkholderia pseudomallei MSHR983]|nr:alginate lyase family protein [Burkholderia pseudomallei MSHR305]AHK67475.1 alginate lyase family protein [Burkholderia pseudomallei MSHR520]AIP19772.1 alginate lyase family protein [Burkholderia pseudomallei MSHR5855]AIP43146.1 alginate lyase family protein [Burkholderia pseudomallei MSHR5848]AIP82657.1 alginate lyase family protein [Burkholderia pseudomallei]KGU59842.1 alginate lyase family protein [Burkholderia pseudomallei MSHR983]KGX72362.1 alginate lyase family protein [Burkholderia 
MSLRLSITSIIAALTWMLLAVTNAFAQSPSFAVKGRPSTGTILQGGSTTYTAVSVGSNGFSGTVQLSLSGLPTGATASFSPSSVSGKWAVSMLTVNTSVTTPAGTYPLKITGTSGKTVQTTTVQLDVRSAVSFTHPGVLLNITQLNSMASNVNASFSPWQSAYVNASGSALGSLTYTPSPQTSVDSGNSAQTNALINDAQAAYTQALLWYITRNTVYGDNAIKIMNAWASTFTGGFSGSNAINIATWTGDVWPRAAEIIRYTYLNGSGNSVWAASDITAFKKFLSTWYVPLVTQGRPFGYYGGNLNSSSAAASINIGVFNDDAITFLRGIWLWRYTLPAYIYIASDGPTPVPPVNWTASNSTTSNLGTLWHNQNPLVNGLSQETCRDLGHVRWGFAALANAAETAHSQGFDLFGESTLGTANTVRLQAGLEFNATYLNGASVPSWLCSGKIALGSSVGTGELAYNDLVNRRALSLSQMNTYLSSVRPTGASYFMNWETLTHFSNP